MVNEIINTILAVLAIWAFIGATGVYLVQSVSMARWAAALMLAGVEKSGSPAPKSRTATPSRRRRSTVAVTFIVGDEAMRDVRLASWVMRLSVESGRRLAGLVPGSSAGAGAGAAAGGASPPGGAGGVPCAAAGVAASTMTEAAAITHGDPKRSNMSPPFAQ